MASTSELSSLELWSLAAFRAASFTAAVVLSFHLRGSLPATLSRLDTATGFGFFLLLWATTWFATRTGLRYGRGADGLVDRRVMPTIVAGGWNGVYVFIGLQVALLFLMIPEQRVASILVVAVIGSILGSLLAFVVGAVAGVLYGLVDAILFGVSARLFQWVATPDGSSTGNGIA
jgi:hypothetical protein